MAAEITQRKQVQLITLTRLGERGLQTRAFRYPAREANVKQFAYMHSRKVHR